MSAPSRAQRRNRLLKHPWDAILHLGQSPGIGSIKLETIALNVAGCVSDEGEELPAIISDGPLAFQSKMPLGRWAKMLREKKIPATISYHAGTFLCNATMYLSHAFYSDEAPAPEIGFIHLPLATEQVAAMHRAAPSLPTPIMAQAVRLILDDLIGWKQASLTQQTSKAVDDLPLT